MALYPQEETSAQLRPYLHAVVEQCIAILQQPGLFGAAAGVKQAVIRVLMKICTAMSGLVGDDQTRMYEAVLGFMRAVLEVYEVDVVQGEDASGMPGVADQDAEAHASEGYDSEGDAMGLEALVMQAVEWLTACLTVKQKVLKRVLRDHLGDWFGLLVALSRMTADQHGDWLDDPNQYVADGKSRRWYESTCDDRCAHSCCRR